MLRQESHKEPLPILTHVCSLLSYWTGLYNPETQGKILEGVQALLTCAHKMMACQPSPSNTARILPSPSDDEQEDGDQN